jgi:hypothetical protein
MRKSLKSPSAAPAPASKLAYSIPEVMVLADAGRTSVYRAIKQGDLIARKRGRRTLVLAHDLEQWLSSMEPINPS